MDEGRIAMRSGRFSATNYLIIFIAIFGIGFLVSFPFFTSIYYIDMVSKALIMGLFAISMDLIWGYTGILNMGHAALLGLGSYTFVLVLKHVHGFNPSYLGVAMAIVLPMALAFIIGLVTFVSRTTEVYFAIITLAIGLLLEKITMVWYSFTGGYNGIMNFPPLHVTIPGGLTLSLNSRLKYYYFVLSVCAILFMFCRKLVRSPFGKVLIAIRDNEQRTALIGYNTNKYKIIIYVISAGIAGLSGAMLAPVNGIVFPGLFGLMLSAQVLICVAVGGRGTLVGAFGGAVFITMLETLLSDVSVMAYLIVLGIIFILIVLFLPQGLAGVVLKKLGMSK